MVLAIHFVAESQKRRIAVRPKPQTRLLHIEAAMPNPRGVLSQGQRWRKSFRGPSIIDSMFTSPTITESRLAAEGGKWLARKMRPDTDSSTAY